MEAIRMAQWGTGHGHAAGKLLALRSNPQVELAGVYEPDTARRGELERQEPAYRGVCWFDDPRELLEDPTIVAVASEGRNDESLDQTEALVQAGKQVWYDKPAGDSWEQWRRVTALAQERGTLIQMGYMFRYHDGFRRIAAWAREGVLGEVFKVRAQMSTSILPAARAVIARHAGGIFYDLGGHMLDQVVWLLGRPQRVSAFLHHDAPEVPGFEDNTLAVLEYERSMAFVDIAAMEAPPMARRFEVYGSRGSAIMEPFEPASRIRLCLAEPWKAYTAGEQWVPLEDRTRQRLYELELEAFVATLRGLRAPERTPEHDLLVQETLLRATGGAVRA
jgi:predicted dehydrogenase